MVLFPATMTKLLRSGLVELLWSQIYTNLYSGMGSRRSRSSWSFVDETDPGIEYCETAPFLGSSTEGGLDHCYTIAFFVQEEEQQSRSDWVYCECWIRGHSALKESQPHSSIEWCACTYTDCENEWGSFLVREWGQAGFKSAFAAVDVNCQFSVTTEQSTRGRRALIGSTFVHLPRYPQYSMISLLAAKCLNHMVRMGMGWRVQIPLICGSSGICFGEVPLDQFIWTSPLFLGTARPTEYPA